VSGPSPYASPRHVEDPADCVFYHTMDLPGLGVVQGQWDLREGADEYTGGVKLAGKRVLEVGTASGFLCFHMERRGADVVGYDLSDAQPWDLVPFASIDVAAVDAKHRDVIRRMNNSWWLAHRLYSSSARVVYGSVYEIPAAIGPVDVATYCAILLHVRDPFLALANGLRLTRETAVVTEIVGDRLASASGGLGPTGRPAVEFIPNAAVGGPLDTWWFLTPEVLQAYLGVLGFEDSSVSYHRQKGSFGECDFFTVVAHRTKGEVVP
jgi:SAM-dependent methyltransferase